MLTNRVPENWKALQQDVAQILSECGFSVDIEKTIRTVRGEVAIDVFGQEMVDGRRYTIVCECKHWAARVPRTVIHGFRTVVADSGANLGYIVSSAGFQAGAFTAAELTNLRLVTWKQFQEEFQTTWIRNYFFPVITERLHVLFDCTAPLLPFSATRLGRSGFDQFIGLRAQHETVGVLIFNMFMPSAYELGGPLPELPLRANLDLTDAEIEEIPAAILDAQGYRDLLDAILEYGTRADAEFRSVISVSEED